MATSLSPISSASRLGAAVFFLTATLVLGGCSGGSGASHPTDPGGDSTSVFTLPTSWGDVAVVIGGHEFDPGRALASIEEGYAKARAQMGTRIDGIRLDEYRIIIMPEDWELQGQHLRDRREIRMRLGVENVLEHELQHFFAWELGRFSDCRTFQDHPNGFDLHCARL
jgi:predicted metal-dependent phosphoesterase TrpH